MFFFKRVVFFNFLFDETFSRVVFFEIFAIRTIVSISYTPDQFYAPLKTVNSLNIVFLFDLDFAHDQLFLIICELLEKKLK